MTSYDVKQYECYMSKNSRKTMKIDDSGVVELEYPWCVCHHTQQLNMLGVVISLMQREDAYLLEKKS